MQLQFLKSPKEDNNVDKSSILHNVSHYDPRF